MNLSKLHRRYENCITMKRVGGLYSEGHLSTMSVLTHLRHTNRWGANAKAFSCLVSFIVKYFTWNGPSTTIINWIVLGCFIFYVFIFCKFCFCFNFHFVRHTFKSNILYAKEVSISFGGWAAFSNSWTYLNCTEDMKILLLWRDLGGCTPKGIYQQWVLTHLQHRNCWGANAKAF
jgi:hypothetical protein